MRIVLFVGCLIAGALVGFTCGTEIVLAPEPRVTEIVCADDTLRLQRINYQVEDQ